MGKIDKPIEFLSMPRDQFLAAAELRARHRFEEMPEQISRFMGVVEDNISEPEITGYTARLLLRTAFLDYTRQSAEQSGGDVTGFYERAELMADAATLMIFSAFKAKLQQQEGPSTVEIVPLFPPLR